jgi:glycosyltransferase involved in cell wall biosynthesis
MIVRDEEQVLGRCLSTVEGIAEEIIIADTGSSDRTKEIAREFGATVCDFKWIDDFSAARNFSFSKAVMDYQMWLDADDIILPNDREKILELKRTLPPDTDLVTMKYNTHFDEDGSPILTSTRGRLFRRLSNFVWNDPVHEYIVFCGKVYHAPDIFITHRKESAYTSRNLRIYERLVAEGKPLSARGMYYFARELRDNGRFAEAAKYFEAFVEGGEGWVEDNIASCFHLGSCWLRLCDIERAIDWLLRGFHYDAPRAEICCELGYCYQQKKDYRRAREWYLLAARLDKPNNMGFMLHDYWGYIPNIELAVCSYNLGKYNDAVFYNEKAAEYKPSAKAVQHNRNFFASLL